MTNGSFEAEFTELQKLIFPVALTWSKLPFAAYSTLDLSSILIPDLKNTPMTKDDLPSTSADITSADIKRRTVMVHASVYDVLGHWT